MSPLPADDRLTAFLYTLMRDHLPVGDTTTIVRELSTKDSFHLTTQPLALLAREMAKELRG